jgi:hypothetical protein
VTATAPPRTPKPPVAGRGFGRLVSYDLRDTAHPMRAYLPATNAAVTHKAWSTKPSVDQGQTPQCGGYSALTLLQAGPVINDRTASVSGTMIYDRAQTMDEWSNEPHDGTSARGAMKALQSFGFITGYAWAGHAHDAVDWLLAHGPVIVGSAWPDSMMEPTWAGIAKTETPYLRVDRTALSAPDVEGHLWTAYATHTTAKNPDGSVGYIIMQNSWGDGWAKHGHARITIPDFEVLITAEGECVTPVEIINKS